MEESSNKDWTLLAGRDGSEYRYVRTGPYVVLCVVASRLARRDIPRRPETAEWRSNYFAVVRVDTISSLWTRIESGESISRQDVYDAVGDEGIREFRPRGSWDFPYTPEEAEWAQRRIAEDVKETEWALWCRSAPDCDARLVKTAGRRADILSWASRIASYPEEFGLDGAPEAFWVLWVFSADLERLQEVSASTESEFAGYHIPAMFSGRPLERLEPKTLQAGGPVAANEAEVVRRILERAEDVEVLMTGGSYRLRCPYAHTHPEGYEDSPAYLITADSDYAASMHCADPGCQLGSRAACDVGREIYGLEPDWLYGGGGRRESTVEEAAGELAALRSSDSATPLRVESERGLELLEEFCRRISSRESEEVPVIVSTQPEEVKAKLSEYGVKVHRLEPPRVVEKRCGQRDFLRQWQEARYLRPLYERARRRQMLEKRFPQEPRRVLDRFAREEGPAEVCRHCPLSAKSPEERPSCSYRERIHSAAKGEVDVLVVSARHWNHEVSIGDLDGFEPVLLAWGDLEEIRRPVVTVFDSEIRQAADPGPLALIPESLAFGGQSGELFADEPWRELTVEDVEGLCQEGAVPLVSVSALPAIREGGDLRSLVRGLAEEWRQAEAIAGEHFLGGYSLLFPDVDGAKLERFVDALRAGRIDAAIDAAREIVSEAVASKDSFVSPILDLDASDMLDVVRPKMRVAQVEYEDASFEVEVVDEVHKARVLRDSAALFSRLRRQYWTETVRTKEGAIRLLWLWAMSRVRDVAAITKRSGDEESTQKLYAASYGSLDGPDPEVAICRDDGDEFDLQRGKNSHSPVHDPAPFEHSSQILHSYRRGWSRNNIWKRENSWLDQLRAGEEDNPLAELVEILRRLEEQSEKWGVVTHKGSPLLNTLETRFDSFRAEHDSRYFGAEVTNGALSHLDWLFVIGTMKPPERRCVEELVRRGPNLRLAQRPNGADSSYWRRRTASGDIKECYVPPHRAYYAKWPHPKHASWISSTEVAARIDERELHRAVHAIFPTEGGKRIVLLGRYGVSCEACATVFNPELLERPEEWVGPVVKNRQSGGAAVFPGQVRIGAGGGHLYRVSGVAYGQGASLPEEQVRYIERLSRCTPMTNGEIREAVGVSSAGTITRYQKMSKKERRQELNEILQKERPSLSTEDRAELLGLSAATLRRYY